jgi:hypothetical protein
VARSATGSSPSRRPFRARRSHRRRALPRPRARQPAQAHLSSHFPAASARAHPQGGPRHG